MKLLLDTHYLIWLVDEPDRISIEERNLLTGGAGLLVSTFSLWEVRLKWQARHGSGVRKLNVSPQAVFDSVRFLGFDWLVPDPATLTLELTHPLAHRDPFDEILLVQAQAAGARLLSRDALLADHPLVLRL
ncbi:hypothetical protein IP88_08575 [alpha proteobacterium AAP81b]|nr:hypothetical protein IP88_08575 [alpha proteobacterium AAP81b]